MRRQPHRPMGAPGAERPNNASFPNCLETWSSEILPVPPVPAVPDARFGIEGAMGTANTEQPNHLAAAYPPDPLYPPLFSEDRGSNAVEALLPQSG